MTWTDLAPTDPTEPVPGLDRALAPAPAGRWSPDAADDLAQTFTGGLTGGLGSARAVPWHARADDLAAELFTAGCSRDRRLLRAVASTPTSLLAAPDTAAGPNEHGVQETPGRVASGDGVTSGRGVDPAALVWMLGLLGRRADPVRALLVGADAWAAAVWCADLGAAQVVVTDHDVRRAETTRRALDQLGHAPTIITGTPDVLAGADGPVAQQGPFHAVLIPRAAGTQRRGLVEGSARWQRLLAPDGRLVAGPVNRPGRSRLARIQQWTPAGGWTSWVADPTPLGPIERLALAHLIEHPDLAEQQRAEHAADAHGYCAACSGGWSGGDETRDVAESAESGSPGSVRCPPSGRLASGGPVRAPCPARQLADLAHAASVSLLALLAARPLEIRPPRPGAQN